MKYTPKELIEEVNIPKESPLKELSVLLGGILALIIGVYIITGFAVDLMVSHIPSKIEYRLQGLYGNYFDKKRTETEIEIQEILDDLVSKSSLIGKSFVVHVVKDSTINAAALPGGNIIVFSGLLKEVQSENELSYVLAHELGHYFYRDHLRSMGRGIILLVISTVLFGQDSSITNFIMNSIQNIEMKFSQQQEINADLWALDLVNKKYGHVGGMEEFLDKTAKKEKLGRFFYFFATHPHPIDRLSICKKEIAKSGYLRKELTPIKLAE